MFGLKVFRTRPSTTAGQALFDGAVRQARTTAFYEAMGVPDTVLGRFELYTLHVVLLSRRLRGQGPQAQETAQAMFDAYLLNLDIALREMGIEDLSMGKKMKKLGRAFYGRIKSWDEALGDPVATEALVARTVYGDAPGADPSALAVYIQTAADVLVRQDEAILLGGTAEWPEITI